MIRKNIEKLRLSILAQAEQLIRSISTIVEEVNRELSEGIMLLPYIPETDQSQYLLDFKTKFESLDILRVIQIARKHSEFTYDRLCFRQVHSGEETFSGFLLGINKIQGTMTRNGETYIGEYENNKMNGQGTFKYVDRKEVLYEGGWKNNKYHGEGLVAFTSGDSLQGFFFNDKLHGKAVLKRADGTSKSQKYDEGKLI